MCPSAAMMSLVGWLCVLLSAVSVQSEKLYKKVGDEVVLQPGTTSAPIKAITWREGSDIAMEWDGIDIDGYRQFKDRGRLNITTGEMTIIGLTLTDSGTYTPDINGKPGPPTELIVIAPVPTPTLTKMCDDEETSCILTCDGNTTNAAPLTYKWKSDDKVFAESSKAQRITKKDSSNITEFSCELENPVSQESSRPIPNPFISEPTEPDPTEPAEGLKINTGVTVFISLLTAVVLLVLIHRWKAGMWFFQKEAMPWEADFWRKDERQRRDAAEANGTTARQVKEQTEEETPMA